MLLLVILVLIAGVLAGQKQPPGCPFPTGPALAECGPNAYFEVCSFKCPPQTCPSESDEQCDHGDGCCRSECRCNKGYFRNDDNACISADQCGSTCPLKCKSTCANPNPIGCDPNPNCYCQSGSVWSTDGRKCIPISKCPSSISCNGDPNAHIMEKPPPCPSTCDTPDGSPFCKRMGLAVGCACNYGYLLDSEGTCVAPETCPGGHPCGINGTFAPCKMDCPNNFCPVDVRRGYIACDPAPDCPSGCVCKYKYRWRSLQDRQCILAQECPARDCTANYEEWNSCPSPCLDESCSSFNNPPSACNTFQEPECYPQCTCKTGYARNDEDVCIPGEDCAV